MILVLMEILDVVKQILQKLSENKFHLKTFLFRTIKCVSGLFIFQPTAIKENSLSYADGSPAIHIFLPLNMMHSLRRD